MISHSTPDQITRTLPMAIASEKKATTFIDRIVRPAEISIITGRSPASIWRDQHADPPRFPLFIRLGENAVGIRLSTLLTWLDSRETVTGENVKIVAPGTKRGRKKKTAQSIAN